METEIHPTFETIGSLPRDEKNASSVKLKKTRTAIRSASHAEPLEGVVVPVRVLSVEVLEQVDLGAGLARGGRRVAVAVVHAQHAQHRQRMQRGQRRQRGQEGQDRQGRLCPFGPWPLVVRLGVHLGWRRRAHERSLRRPSTVLRTLPSIAAAAASASASASAAASSASAALHLRALVLVVVLLVVKLRDVLRFYVRHLTGKGGGIGGFGGGWFESGYGV